MLRLFLYIWFICASPPSAASEKAQSHDFANIHVLSDRANPNMVHNDEITLNSRIIERAEFEHKATNLGELIQQQTGTWVRSSGGSGSFSQLSLRGASTHQTVIYLDGVRLNSANGASVDLSQIPVTNIERITIYKGSAPLQFGQIFQGGVVHIETRSHNINQANQITTETASYGFYNVGLSHGKKFQQGNYLLNLTHQQVDNNFHFIHDNGTPLNPYDDRKERRNNAQTKMDNILLKADYDFSPKQTLTTQLTWNDSRQNLPNRQNSPENNAQFSRNVQQWQIGLHQHQVKGSNWDSSSELSFLNTEERYLDDQAFIGLGRQDNRYNSRNMQLRQYLSTPFDLSQLYAQVKLNLEYQHETYQSLYRSFNQSDLVSDTDKRHERQTLNFAVELPAQYHKFKFVPTLRWQQLNDQADATSPTNQSTKDQDVTGNLGMSYQVNSNLSLTANIAKAVRQPSFYEKYADRGYVLGNPNLKKETAQNRDIGFDIQHHHLQAWWQLFTFDGKLFLNDVQDIIVMTYDARGIGRATNLSSARILGLEISTHLLTRNKTEIDFNYTQIESVTQDSYSGFNNKAIANTPPKKLSIRLKQGFQEWRFYYEYLFSEGSFYDRANLLKIDDKHLHNLGVTYQTKTWLATAEAKNLLDKNYQDFNGYPTPGKSYHLKLQYKF